MARDFDVLYVSGRVNTELGIDKFVWLHFESVQQGENTHEHLWFPILNSAFSSPNYHFLLFNYNLNKNLLIRNL